MVRVLTQRKQLPATLFLQNSRITPCIPGHLEFQGTPEVWQWGVCSCILPAANPKTSLCHRALPAGPAAGRVLSHWAEELSRLLWTLQAALELETAQQCGHTSHSLEIHGVPYEREAASAGAKRRDTTSWTETINCYLMCQLFLLFSHQLSNSVYLLWRRERKAGKTKMNSEGEKKKNLLNFFFFVTHIFKHLFTLTF